MLTQVAATSGTNQTLDELETCIQPPDDIPDNNSDSMLAENRFGNSSSSSVASGPQARIGLFGLPGSGKSTLLRQLMGCSSSHNNLATSECNQPDGPDDPSDLQMATHQHDGRLAVPPSDPENSAMRRHIGGCVFLEGSDEVIRAAGVASKEAFR